METTPRVGLVPVAVALFVCVTGPLEPGLPTRTETFTFRAPVWLAVADPVVCDAALCPVAPGWADALGAFASWVCSICWPSSFSLRFIALPVADVCWSTPKGPAEPVGPEGVAWEGRLEPAEALALFVWLTGPFEPGLSTRTTTLTLCGAVWPAEAFAEPVEVPVPVAAAAAEAWFVWSTGPMSPELPTLTATFVLLGFVCDAVAEASVVEADADPAEVPSLAVDAAEPWLPVDVWLPPADEGWVPAAAVPPWLPVASPVAAAAALFAWPTDPAFPGSSTLTDTFPLPGPVWVASAEALTVWAFELGPSPGSSNGASSDGASDASSVEAAAVSTKSWRPTLPPGVVVVVLTSGL